MSEILPGAAGSQRPVVTLFESYGSGAGYIGPRVAQALGVPFHEQAFSSQQIEDAAERRVEDEGVLSRFFGTVGGSYAGLEGRSVAHAQRDDYELVLENTRIIHEQADQGGVITGRNGAMILANWPGALHVMLDGAQAQRIERAAREAGIDIQQAAKRQKREDQFRADMSLSSTAGIPGDGSLRPRRQLPADRPGPVRRHHRRRARKSRDSPRVGASAR